MPLIVPVFYLKRVTFIGLFLSYTLDFVVMLQGSQLNISNGSSCRNH